MMIHKIHTGANLEAKFNQDYIVVGFGGSENDFGAAFASVPASIPNTGVRFPAMGPTGAVQDTAECYMCHANGSEAVLPIGKNAVTDPQGLLNPAPATTSACTACHLNQSALRTRKPTPIRSSAKAATFVTAPAPLSARRRFTRGCETAARLQAIPCRK